MLTVETHEAEKPTVSHQPGHKRREWAIGHLLSIAERKQVEHVPHLVDGVDHSHRKGPVLLVSHSGTLLSQALTKQTRISIRSDDG